MSPLRKDLPTGTVTFLFTDVEGSTRLLAEMGAEGYAAALSEHRLIVRKACGGYGGVEVDTQGDAFFIAFATAPGAMAAATHTRDRLAAGPIRVRMGIHTGTPLLTDEGYVGSDVHRAARIGAAGHGGQVLVSATTAVLLGLDGFRDLGEHRLKDLGAPERIFQLGDEHFPPLKTISNTNLPIATSPLIGRKQELAELVSLLVNGGRLVTVTGPGGTGKTRFALQAAAELVNEFVDGVFWVPLQSLSDGELVIPTIGQAIGAGEDLEAHLRSRKMLLLLDNFEHLLSAAPAVAALLAGCPGLRLLVTSRAPLRVAGEREMPLDPLPDHEASSLFIERARDAGRDVQPDETVAAICRRLDNLPLAIELAAARTRLLDPSALLARLEHSRPILTGGRRDAPARQQTLRATIEWSYDLLDADAKRLFFRLAVFTGTFSLEAAELLCDANVDSFAALVELSLLKSVGNDRFLMLETIHEYARDLLIASGESDARRNRHAEHFLTLIPGHRLAGSPAQTTVRVTGQSPISKDKLDRAAEDYDNLRAAVQWLRVTGDIDRELSAVDDLVWTFLNVRGRVSEAGPMLESALSRADGADAGVRADALVTLAIFSGHVQKTDREAAQRAANAGLALARGLGDKVRIQRALRTVARFQDDRDERIRMLLECDALARELGDPWALGWVQMLLGHQAILDGNLEEARARLEEQLTIFEPLGNKLEIARCWNELGFLAVLEERFADARRLFGRSLVSALEIGATNFVSESLDGLAAVAVSDGDAEGATRVLAAVATIREENGDTREAYQIPMLERAEAAARERLGPGFDIAWEAGTSLTLDEAVGLALGEPD